MEREQTVSVVQEADINNPAGVEAAADCEFENADMNSTHPNKVPQVMNESPVVTDDKDDGDFDENDIIFEVIINKAEKTKTQVDVEELVEYEEVNNNNDFLKTVTRPTARNTTHKIYGVIQD